MAMTLIQQSAPYPHWEFVHPSSGDCLRIVPERGGLVTAWSCDGREMLYFDQTRFADPAKSIRGGIPVLFPICGNLPGDVLPVDGVNHILKQHGFARDLPWKLQLLEDQSGLQLTLTDTEQTRTAFPFPFQLVMALRPLAQALEITTTVTHMGHGSGAMPFSFGLHPYFKVSDLGRTRLEGLPARCLNHLEMAEADTAPQLARLPEGVDFLCREAEGPVTLIDQRAGIKVQLDQPAPMDLTVIWTEPPRPMVCLEPWTGPRQALISGDHKLQLAVGESIELRCTYRVSEVGGSSNGDRLGHAG
ncbi:galactose mutarotase [Synechococcus sp. UW140]|uniref:aldose epimerase family protein n=1 Tax=Synechococcus sp. UW140 TaxID=368503 RepID=UPI000E0E8853|nr:galactose mutarotase [Synechococcus sp. UW140]